MDFAEGGRGGDVLRGGSGSDELDDFQPSDIDDTDQLLGWENDDFLYAVDGDGNDTLNCGPGADDCYGDDGDTIVNCENESTDTSVSRASSASGARKASILLH